MTGLYVYGITRSPVRTRTRGVFGRTLRTVQVGRLHVIVERAEMAPRPAMPTLNAQSRAIAALVAAGTDVLPARFGAFVSDVAELHRMIGARGAHLARALRLVKGRVQMTVRVRMERPLERRTATKAVGGTEYLRARAARASGRRSDPLLRAIQAAAKPYARATEVDWQEGPTAMARVHHLVPRGRVAAYAEAVSRAVQRHEADAVMSGPWAPFAFVEAA